MNYCLHTFFNFLFCPRPPHSLKEFFAPQPERYSCPSDEKINPILLTFLIVFKKKEFFFFLKKKNLNTKLMTH